MERIRRIDWTIQAVIGIATLAVACTYYYGLMGLFLLGVWQVVSAVFNTTPMWRSLFRRNIKIYWVLVAVALVMFYSTSDLLQIFSLFVSFGIAIYYWLTYKSFIEYVVYRKELETLIRH